MTTLWTQTKHSVRLFIVVSCCLLLWGCPSDPPGEGSNNPDGGNTTEKVQPLTCEKGVLCVQIGNKDVRACDLLLKNDKMISQPNVNFDESITGQFKYRDSRLALSFITQKDSGTETYSALVQIANGVSKLKVLAATCYDRKGAKLDKPDLKLVRP